MSKARTFKKVLCVLLALVLTATLFSGCGDKKTSSSGSGAPVSSAGDGKTSQADNSGEPYEVNFLYIVAKEGSGQQAVNDAVNELAMKELNMKVNMIPMTYGSWREKISMMLAGGEALDILPVLSMDFSSYIDSQYIVNAADYTDVLPDVYETLGDDATAAQVGDFLVGFAGTKERSFPTGFVCRKDIFDELGYKVEDFNVNVEDMSSWDKLTELFAAVKEKYPDMTVIDGTAAPAIQTMTYRDTLGDEYGMGSLNDYATGLKVENYFETQQFKDLCNVAREWYLAGYESQDIATNQENGQLKLKAGNTFGFFNNVKPNSTVEVMAQTGYETVVIPVSECLKSTNCVSGVVFSVANAAKDKQKAFEFLNWTYKSGEFQDLINWGVEGTHWVETKDGMAAYPEGVDATNAEYHNDMGWIYQNQFAGHPWTGNPADIWEQYDEYNSSCLVSSAFGFVFDAAPYADQIATCNTVYQEYYKNLGFGVVEIEPTIEEFNQALYDAGLQDIIDAKQEQLDEWVKNQK